MPAYPSIHIDRTSLDGDKARYVLTVEQGSDGARAEDLAEALARAVGGYSSHVKTSPCPQPGCYLLIFETDKKPLSKWDMGKINRAVILEHIQAG